jgi:hypothetical protein
MHGADYGRSVRGRKGFCVEGISFRTFVGGNLSGHFGCGREKKGAGLKTPALHLNLKPQQVPRRPESGLCRDDNVKAKTKKFKRKSKSKMLG